MYTCSMIKNLYKNIGPSFCVLGCDTAIAGSGYIRHI